MTDSNGDYFSYEDLMTELVRTMEEIESLRDLANDSGGSTIHELYRLEWLEDRLTDLEKRQLAFEHNY
jgi:hypothetical protein